MHPVVRDEIVYVSADPDRVRGPVTPAALAAAVLVLSEATWGDDDYTRRQLRHVVQSAGGSLQPAIEVENVETALEVAALGIADAVTARGVVRRQRDRLATSLFSVSPRAPSLRPLRDRAPARRDTVTPGPGRDRDGHRTHARDLRAVIDGPSTTRRSVHGWLPVPSGRQGP
ncbi:LysR substrate-binding domain-containing protein [Pseudonocardia halophobica]|uniref:LysR substrate-binding domain-containing protein n=1 Tax=Pseudonocardia halophobica TaxID=29401 RepID=UPI003D8F66BA